MPKKKGRKKKSSGLGSLIGFPVAALVLLTGVWFAFGRGACIMGSLGVARDRLADELNIADLRTTVGGVDLLIMPAIGTNTNSVALVQLADGSRLTYQIMIGLPRANQRALMSARRMRNQMYDTATGYFSGLKPAPGGTAFMDEEGAPRFEPEYVTPTVGDRPMMQVGELQPHMYIKADTGRELTLREVRGEILTLMRQRGMDFVREIHFPVLQVAPASRLPTDAEVIERSR